MRTFTGWLAVIVLALLGGVASARDADGELKLVIILGRHGVRSPIQSNQYLDQFSAQPWPVWPVTSALLTPHGEQQMRLLGRYYRLRYRAEGLLTREPAGDAARVVIRADNDQRTILSARLFGAALVDGVSPRVQAEPAGRVDTLFAPIKLPVGRPDSAMAEAAVLGRLGGDPSNLVRAHAATYQDLHDVLFGSAPVPPGKIDPFRLGESVDAGDRQRLSIVGLTGPIYLGLRLVDALELEYVEGMPMAQVGWGRLNEARLTELLSLHSLHFELAQKTRYPAQAQGSNLAWHIAATIDQAVAGAPVPGALARPDQSLVILMGHDTNQMNIAGLLDLSWMVPGAAEDPVLPGGALVFELRRTAVGAWNLRALYISQRLDQMRRGDPLSLEHPPAVAPIFIPDCSEAGPGYDAPWSSVRAKLDRTIDRRFVAP
jgi:4-phytase/acid phosphatase